MFVKIRTLGGVTFNVLIQGKATILDLKKKLPTPPSYLKNISLVYKGNELPDFMSLQQLQFADTDFLVVVFNKKRHRESKDKENHKNWTTKKQSLASFRSSITSASESEEEHLRNLRRRRNLRLHVGSISSTSAAIPSPLSPRPPSLSDLPFTRIAPDTVSSGSESSDQETSLPTQRRRIDTEDDFLDLDGGGLAGGLGEGLGSGGGDDDNWSRVRDPLTSLQSPGSPTYSPPETSLRAQRDRKSATQAILERMHQRVLTANSTPELKLKVDEEKLNQLVTMGFRKLAATRALLFHRNNLEASVVWLLENSSSTRINDPISSEELAVLSTPFASLGSTPPTTISARSRAPRTRATRASFSDCLGLTQLDSFKFETIPSTQTRTSALGTSSDL